MNNLDSENGAYCKSMMDNACPFTEEMYDWSKKQIKEFLYSNSSNDFLFIRFTWEELGLTKQWYEKECRNLENDLLIIRREIDLQWTKASDNSVFSEESLDSVFLSLKQSIGNIFIQPRKDIDEDLDTLKENYMVKLYRPLIKEKVYFIGSDVGGGTGNDPSAFVIIDPTNLEIAGIFKNNKINTSVYSSLLQTLMEDHLPNSYLFIENNSLGSGVISNLLRKIPSRLFYDYKLPDKEKKKLLHKTPNAIKYGVQTDKTSRSLMIDILFDVMENYKDELCYPEIYDELKTLVYSKNGKVEHDSNAHDDVIFSYLMVKYAMQFSNNISKFLRDSSSIVSNMQKVISKSHLDTENPNELAGDFARPNTEIDIKEYSRLSLQGLSSEEIMKILSKPNSRQERTVNKQVLNLFNQLNR